MAEKRQGTPARQPTLEGIQDAMVASDALEGLAVPRRLVAAPEAAHA